MSAPNLTAACECSEAVDGDPPCPVHPREGHGEAVQPQAYVRKVERCLQFTRDMAAKGNEDAQLVLLGLPRSADVQRAFDPGGPMAASPKTACACRSPMCGACAQRRESPTPVAFEHCKGCLAGPLDAWQCSTRGCKMLPETLDSTGRELGPTPQNIRVLAWVRHKNGQVGQIVAATAGNPMVKVTVGISTLWRNVNDLTYCDAPKTQERSDTAAGSGQTTAEVGAAADAREGARSEPSPLAARDSGEAAFSTDEACKASESLKACASDDASREAAQSHHERTSEWMERSMYGETKVADDDFSEHYERDQAALDDMLAAVRLDTIEECAALFDIDGKDFLPQFAEWIRELAGLSVGAESQEKTQ